ncbi:hypothetical protein V8E36_000291 [Tilletia maclaganii]
MMPMGDDDASTDNAVTSELAGFRLGRVLNEDARMHTASLLGSMPAALVPTTREQVILNIEKTHLAPELFAQLGAEADESNDDGQLQPFAKIANLGQNDIYTWILAWFGGPTQGRSGAGPRAADIKITVIRPATEAHIAKYSAHAKYMVRETPEIYQTIVKPWIQSQPISRINWVYNILDKLKEKDSIIFEDPHPQQGFIIVPDLKWDQRTRASLYLVAIVHDRSLRSLRDLTAQYVPLLRAIREAAQRVAADKYGVSAGKGPSVRCFIHYQPTYYHLHIHILHASFISHTGAIVGQAHLLDDVIDLLELGVDFQKRTLTYALGERHELWDVFAAAGVPQGS